MQRRVRVQATPVLLSTAVPHPTFMKPDHPTPKPNSSSLAFIAPLHHCLDGLITAVLCNKTFNIKSNHPHLHARLRQRLRQLALQIHVLLRRSDVNVIAPTSLS